MRKEQKTLSRGNRGIYRGPHNTKVEYKCSNNVS